MSYKSASTVSFRFENKHVVFRDPGGQLPAESTVETPTLSKGFVALSDTDHLLLAEGVDRE